ncbi:PDZ domain-containing protein [Sphingomonas quercus]|nr:PDZ domain-containing protein [Sphingomonas quercus]
MRFLSWIGWGAALSAVAAMLVLAHAFRHTPAIVARQRPIGATLAVTGTGDAARLTVTSLRTGGPGARAGLRVGDRIEDVDGLPAPSSAAFYREVAGAPHDNLDLHVLRGQALIDIHMKRMRGNGLG